MNHPYRKSFEEEKVVDCQPVGGLVDLLSKHTLATILGLTLSTLSAMVAVYRLSPDYDKYHMKTEFEPEQRVNCLSENKYYEQCVRDMQACYYQTKIDCESISQYNFEDDGSDNNPNNDRRFMTYVDCIQRMDLNCSYRYKACEKYAHFECTEDDYNSPLSVEGTEDDYGFPEPRLQDK